MKNERTIPKLPESELDVMLVLWSYDRPVRIAEIFNDLKSVRPCTKSAIHTLVENLHTRGFINIEHTSDKQSYKLITPIVSEDEYRAAEAGSFVKKLCGGRWQKLICALVDSKEISDSDIGELSELLKEGRK